MKGAAIPSDQAILAAVYAAIADHRWGDHWGAKWGNHALFGHSQIVGQYRDVPMTEIHQIMCKVKPQ